VEAAERHGELSPESILVESSSGNLGVALSMIAASKGYRFLCVTDSRCNTATRRLMEALGAKVHTITTPSKTGGFLGARIDYIRALCAADDRYVWLNQYANPKGRTTTRQLRPSSASSRGSTCCSSAPVPPAH
jgi:N-(2-amino-2-carboxyethyl)-L-glutamate synthase